MLSKLENTYSKMDGYNLKDKFLQPNGGLDIEKILKRFQQFMKEQYSLDINDLDKGYLISIREKNLKKKDCKLKVRIFLRFLFKWM
ncbi:hypothetical protein [Clostridium gasigenes]|uniref:hypothetical protein n=1 Tax=Clostridium gasigenes TaxID=94869 RepID=UPI001C0B9A67|nr:hypothetical protein [Clostridium gasigenes]MBU3106346.1 hypothetical protein [Clostridium gasigenes]